MLCISFINEISLVIKITINKGYKTMLNKLRNTIDNIDSDKLEKFVYVSMLVMMVIHIIINN